MDNKRPKVSIILPVYNGERFLPESLQSVQAQTFMEWELIVIDDGSKDGSAAVVRAAADKDKRIKYVFQKNAGIQKALNHGLSLAKGEYIARIDDDDMWSDKGKLAAQIRFLDEHPDHVLVGTGTIQINEAGKETYRYQNPQTDAEIRGRMLYKNCFTHSSIMMRAAAVRPLGGYSEDKNVLHIEDYDLWLRLGKVGKFANLPMYATTFRLLPGNLSSRNKGHQFRQNLALTWKYRNDYPGYMFAATQRIVQIVGYRVFLLFPKSARLWMIHLYKKA